MAATAVMCALIARCVKQVFFFNRSDGSNLVM